VKPPPFEYAAPASVEEALPLLGEAGTVLAGGQSLVPMMNFRIVRPPALVDISRIPDLRYIARDGDGLRVGGLTVHREIEHADDELLDGFGVLKAAAPLVGHMPIRSRGTFGGSVAHADPSAEWCMLTLLLDGEIVARSAEGERTIAADDLFLGFFTTTLEPGEILAEVHFMRPLRQAAIEEFARRHGDFAIVGVAAMIVRDGDRCRTARLATAGAGPVPQRLRAAEEILERDGLGEAAIEAAARRASELVSPDSDIHASSDYRRHLTGVLTRRALTRALAATRG
jgi:aerobic carbon-monoxide dehydrogenase medium subunit